MNRRSRLVLSALCFAATLLAGFNTAALAQDYGGNGDGYADNGGGGPGPYYGVDQGRCDRAAISHSFEPSQNNIVGSLLGAAAGGLIGSQFGHGSGKSTMTLLGVLGGAMAGGAIGRSMERPDAACVDQTLERGQSGRPVAWENPDNGTQYQMVPQPAYREDDGRYCRNYETTAVIDGQEQTIHGTACRDPNDGTWHTEQ